MVIFFTIKRSGRARRDAATRAMKGWHSGHFRNGEVSDPIIKDKNSIAQQKREKQLKSLGLLNVRNHHIRTMLSRLLLPKFRRRMSRLQWLILDTQQIGLRSLCRKLKIVLRSML
ncbi:uncharacterized protein LOC120118375 [Hibiscus syriacus]|uniref:uncharacterized protein LOC120118375 n=1 Tax=Hibiscus syriacus TaxID=106335 RepID=UPI001923D5C9|nr:uncharacterized protein LOC120118375 [Hibiscus syriacus]